MKSRPADAPAVARPPPTQTPLAQLEKIAQDYAQGIQTHDVTLLAQHQSDDFTVKEPIFGELNTKDATKLDNRLFGENSKGKAVFDIVETPEGNVAQIDARAGTITFDLTADYKKFGNSIHNKIELTLKVEDGKVQSETQSYDTQAWADQFMHGRVPKPLHLPVGRFVANALVFPKRTLVDILT